jgi:hypothetical protein
MCIRVLIQQSFLVCFDLCSFKNKYFFVFKKIIFEEIMYVVIIVLNPCNSCTCIYNKITNTTCSKHINQQQQSNFDIYRDLPPQKKIKYQSWNLTPYCGLEVHKPTQELQSVKGPANTFDWNPKWARTLPSLIYFSCDIYRDLHSTKKKFKYQSWYLTPYCRLEVQKPTKALQSVKGPDNTFYLNPKWAELFRP